LSKWRHSSPTSTNAQEFSSNRQPRAPRSGLVQQFKSASKLMPYWESW
jgi:hypothetical protein